MILDKWKKDALKRNISETSINQKLKLFDQIIKDIDKTNKKLLLVGSVQSGKTSTFIGLISKIFDTNVSNLVIMFAGVTKKLVRQTEERFQKVFSLDDNVEIIKSIPRETDFDEITNKLASGKKIILLSIKHYLHIGNIAKWFNNCKTSFNPLIIDDEGDQASFYNIKKYSIENKHSATYNAFTKFFDVTNNCTFLSVTATPQAHILAHRDFCALDPDYVFLVPDGEDYLTYKDLSSQKGIFKTLTEDDVEQLCISKNDDGMFELLSLPESVKYAIIHYFISHKKWFIEKKHKWYPSQMIINVDKKIIVHYTIRDMIAEFIRDFENSKDYRERVIDFLYPNESIETRNKYIEYALDVITSNDYELRCLNCYNENEKVRDIQGYDTTKQCNIIIGGLTISRGVSFPNLLSFYYINDKPKTYTMDNIIQVCRFLGYRKEQLPYFSIWISKKIQDLLWSMFNADEWIREKVVFYQRHHHNFKKSARFIRIQIKTDADYGIIGTRQSVAKQYKASGIGKSLANDASFNFKSDSDIYLNDQMLKLLNYFIRQYIEQKQKALSDSLGENFGKYPILIYDSFSDLINKMHKDGIDDANEILEAYFKEAVYCKEVIQYLQSSKDKLVVSLMLYDFNENDGSYTSRNISYNSGAKEFSFYRQGIRVDYVGDNNWADEHLLQTGEKINFIQLFSLNAPTRYQDLVENKKIIKMQIVLPNELESRITDAIIAAKDEDLDKIEQDLFEDNKK